MTVDDLARLWARAPVIWSPRVSGDGRWLAWTWTGVTETGEVWIAPTDGSQRPERLTQGQDHFYARSLSHDGSRLVLAQSIGANEHDRLFLLDRADGALRPLTPLQSESYVFGGALTEDGTAVVFSADFEGDAKPVEGSRIYRQDLASGARTMLARSKNVCDIEPELSPDGKLILYGSWDADPSGIQMRVVGLDGSGDREVLNVGDRLKAKAHWLGPGSRGGNRLLVQGETETHERVGVLDLDTGRLRWLIDDPQRGIENIVAGCDGRSAMVLEYENGRLMAKWLDIETGLEQLFVLQEASLLPIAQLPGGAWVCERYSSARGHDLVRIEPVTMRVTNLTRSGDRFAGPFHPARDFRWTSVDGTPIQGWLYDPNGESRGLVVNVHGGPTWHSEDWVTPFIQFMVGAGFTVLDPNYRGSTGFGRAFREAIKRDGWGGAEQDDIRSGIEALIAAGKAQRGKIGVMGLSYGGYSSWIAITRFADLVDAAMPICGMYQLDVDFNATEMPHGRAYAIEMMGGTPDEVPDRYFRGSPANFIRDIKGRLLIVHGLSDSNVSPENTQAACRDLMAARIPFDLLTFDDEGHGVYKAGNREKLLLRMERFFTKAFA
jgi:dipeptidyl aminopeptidase/acylaminoacyl peptidase